MWRVWRLPGDVKEVRRIEFVPTARPTAIQALGGLHSPKRPPTWQLHFEILEQISIFARADYMSELDARSRP